MGRPAASGPARPDRRRLVGDLYFNRLPHKQPDRALDLVLEVLRFEPEKRNDKFMRSLLYAYGVAAIARRTRAPDELKTRQDALVAQNG